MDERSLIAFLGLSGLKGVSFSVISKLHELGAPYGDLFADNDPALFLTALKNAGFRGRKDIEESSWAETRNAVFLLGEKLLGHLHARGVRVIFREDAEYPSQILNIPDPPPWLFVQGNVEALHKSSVAVVGTRNPSSDGVFLAIFAALCCAELDAPVISGLANGIDQTAQERAVRSNAITVSVLGCGILKNYPANSDRLRKRILETGGAIVTEYMPLADPSGEAFVRRNRIQAALAKVVVPVEWKIKSGTAHTVRFAQQYKRKVFGLRLATWDDRSELAAITESDGKVFSVPLETKEFIASIEHELSRPVERPKSQLRFF